MLAAETSNSRSAVCIATILIARGAEDLKSKLIVHEARPFSFAPRFAPSHGAVACAWIEECSILSVRVIYNYPKATPLLLDTINHPSKK